MNTHPIDALFDLKTQACNSWLRSNLEANIVKTATIANREITITIHYLDGRSTWKMNGKRSSYGAIRAAVAA